MAIAPIPPLAWEPPYVMGTALKRQKKKKRYNERSSAVSLELQNTDSVLSPAQWLKESGFPQLWQRSQLWLGSDLRTEEIAIREQSLK